MLLEDISERSTGRNLYLVIQKALKVEMRKRTNRELKDNAKLRKKISSTIKNMRAGTANFRYFEIYINYSYGFIMVPRCVFPRSAFSNTPGLDMFTIWE